MATTGRFPLLARPTFMRVSRTFIIGFGKSWKLLWKYHGWRQELSRDDEHWGTLQQLPLKNFWLVLRNKCWETKAHRGAAGGERLMEVVYISKSILQYLVSDESWKAKLLTVCLQLKLDGGERNDNHCRWTLTEHIVTCNRHMTKESYPVEGAGLR